MRDPVKQTLPNNGFAELMTAVLKKGKPFRFQAAGVSMCPFIRSGDVITIEPVPGLIHFGEVLAFRQPVTDKLAVHRVVGRGRKGLLLKGDNSCHCDGWVSLDKIIGRINKVEHRGRNVRIGLGRERILIAGMSRLKVLRPLICSFYRAFRPVYKRFFA